MGPNNPIGQGKNYRLIDESPSGASSVTKVFTADSETVFIMVHVTSISGTLTVNVFTHIGHETEDKELEVIDFGTLTGADAGKLIIKKAAAITSQLHVDVTTSDAADYEVWVRGSVAGETTTRILGADSAKASQKDIPAAATIIIASALTARDGTVIKNNNIASGKLFLGFTLAETTVANGYPLGTQEALGIDVAAGVSIFGIADTGPIDVRILESGG